MREVISREVIWEQNGMRLLALKLSDGTYRINQRLAGEGPFGVDMYLSGELLDALCAWWTKTRAKEAK